MRLLAELSCTGMVQKLLLQLPVGKLTCGKPSAVGQPASLRMGSVWIK